MHAGAHQAVGGPVRPWVGLELFLAACLFPVLPGHSSSPLEAMEGYPVGEAECKGLIVLVLRLRWLSLQCRCTREGKGEAQHIWVGLVSPTQHRRT